MVAAVTEGPMPQVLIPFDRREAITLNAAKDIAGMSQSTIRNWCSNYDIGRRVGNGRWLVSRVALAMLLDGDGEALRAYLSGDRAGALVAPYFERAGLRTSKPEPL